MTTTTRKPFTTSEFAQMHERISKITWSAQAITGALYEHGLEDCEMLREALAIIELAEKMSGRLKPEIVFESV